MSKYQPPIAKKIPYETVVHGEKVVDNYHWLREPSWPKTPSKSIISYLKEENKYTEQFFKPLKAEIDTIYKEIIGRIKLADQSVPVKIRNYYYSTLTKDTSNYTTYLRRPTPKGKDEVLFDGDKEAKGHEYFSVGSLSVSPNEKLLAYSTDTKGDERYTIRIKNLSSKKLLSDVIKDHIGSIVWDENNEGFYYTKPDKKFVPKKLYYHELGTKQSTDILIYREKDPTFGMGISKTSDYKYIIVNLGSSTSDEIQFIHSTDPKHKLNMLIPRKEDHLCHADHINNFFYISTNDKGKNFRLVRVKNSRLCPKHYEELIAHSDKAYLTGFDLYDDYLIVDTKENGLPQIHIFKYDMKKYDSIKFPDPVYTASSASSSHDDDGLLIRYSSLVAPTTSFRYTFANKQMKTIKVQEIPSGYNKNEYKCERVLARSRDGKTKIPVSLVYKKSLFKNDGANPLFLYGYGSYGAAIPPSFNITKLSLVDRGFVYAIAHVRGGDDLGFKWYEEAKFLNKKLTFNDFIDCAKFLIDQNYTSKGNIAISGGSAGGMLIGNVINQAPELFKAAIADVPFVDVLNTMLDETLPLTPLEFKEWGNPKDKKFFDYIKSYSPYDNVVSQNYPALYVLAGLNDSRVTYWEPAKWVAKLRAAKTDNNILLLETNMESGHAGKTARFESVKELAREYVFILRMFKIRLKL